MWILRHQSRSFDAQRLLIVPIRDMEEIFVSRVVVESAQRIHATTVAVQGCLKMEVEGSRAESRSTSVKSNINISSKTLCR